jgi:putative ABC transport system substrate-binding protein
LGKIYFILRIWAAVTALFILPVAGQAKEILVLRSAPLKPYDEAIAGLNLYLSTLPASLGIKTIAPHTVISRDISGPAAVDDLSGVIAALSPDLLLAVGNKALAAAQGLDIPVISLLAPDANIPPNSATRIYHIPLVPSPVDQLAAIRSTLPKIGRVGILYDPRHSGALVDAFRAAAKPQNMAIVARELADPKELSNAIAAIQGEIDAVLLIPDLTVVTPFTLDAFALFSLKTRIPLIVFAPKYLRHGGALAVYTTPTAMGEAAGRLAQQLLSGMTINSNQAISPAVGIAINQRILRKLGYEAAREGSGHTGGEEP